MTLPLISAYAGAAITVLQIFLMMRVGLYRTENKISVGDNNDEVLLYRIRAHANLIENAPLFLILLTTLEITGGSRLAVLGLAIMFVVARIAHAIALSKPKGPQPARAVGALGTMLGLLGAAGTLVWHLSTTTG